MDLLKTQLSGEPLAISLKNGTSRLIAELFIEKNGIVFVDIGWCDPLCSFLPFHSVRGEVTGEDPWRVAESVIYKVTSGDPLFPEWQQWLKYKASLKINSREDALISINDGGLDDVDILK